MTDTLPSFGRVTSVASCRVRHGTTAENAIAEVRRTYNPLAMENAAQEEAVRRFAARRSQRNQIEGVG